MNKPNRLQEKMKIKKQFFYDVAEKRVILVGVVKNEYGEMYCVYRINATDENLFITGDEFDWKEQEFDYKNVIVRDFLFSNDEIYRLKSITHYM